MILFIDAYNLLKQIFSTAQIGQGKHLGVEHACADFARMQGHTIFMVYDGGSSPREERASSGPFTKILSGYSQTADDVIKQRIGAHPPEKTVLISQDRQLCAHVARSGYHSVDPLDFYQYVRETTQTGTVARKLQGPLVKLSRLEHAALDALMHEASLMPFYKEDEQAPAAQQGSLGGRGYSQPKKSKKEKKIHRIIKPL